MSILFLYHILGKEKRSEMSQTNTNNSDFDSLKMDESDKQLRERVYDIKMRENRAAQHHTTDCATVINSEITQSFESFMQNGKEPIKPNLDTI
jgi:hypothetical protein